MTGRDRLWGLMLGALTGVAGGLFGVGGGIVIIPLLTGHFRLSQHQAHGTSLAVIGLAALASLTIYAAHSNVDWATGFVIGLASFLTARLGARMAVKLSARSLSLAFAVFQLAMAARLIWNPSPAALVQGGSSAALFDIGLGLVVGLISGLMGVGGGILIVPALVLLAGTRQQLAQGTSLLAILFTTSAGARESARHGNVVRRLVPVLAAGTAVGGFVASFVAQRLPGPLLSRAFAAFLLVSAIHTWWKSARAGPGAGGR